MKPVMFREMTNVLGAPKNWDAEKNGECLGLPVMIDREAGMILSCWKPSPEELAALQAGAVVVLQVCSLQQPPVSINVAQREP